MNEIAIPTVEELTPTWFTEVLRYSHALDATTRVTAADVSRFGSDESMMSALYRARLDFDGPTSAPTSLIIKLASDSPEQRSVAAMTKFYEREIRFYNEIASQMIIETPRSHLAKIDTSDQSFVLVLEEVAGRQVDQVEGAGYEDAVAALIELADLQVPLWGTHLESEAETFMAYDSPLMHAIIPGIFGGQWDKARPRAVGDLPAEVISLLDHRGENTAEILAGMSGPDTFCHGDYRIDNLLFGAEGSVTALDYQLGSVGHGMTDVAYFISQSVADQVAADSADDLINVYLDRLRTHGMTIDFDEAMRPYRAGLVFFTAIPVGILTFDGVPERAERLAKTMLRRASAEILRTGAHLEFSRR